MTALDVARDVTHPLAERVRIYVAHHARSGLAISQRSVAQACCCYPLQARRILEELVVAGALRRLRGGGERCGRVYGRSDAA